MRPPYVLADVENQPRVADKGSSLSRVTENQHFSEALPHLNLKEMLFASFCDRVGNSMYFRWWKIVIKKE